MTQARNNVEKLRDFLPSEEAYTVDNAVEARAFDADDSSIDELADVLGTLIADLQAAGIIS
jgi:hypothetical protein